MSIIKKIVLARTLEKVTLIHYWWQCKLVWSLWKSLWSILKKAKRTTQNMPKGLHNTAQRHLSIHAYCSSVFTIARKQNQPKGPSRDEPIFQNVVQIHNGIWLKQGKWMELKNCIIWDNSGSERQTTHGLFNMRTLAFNFYICAYMWEYYRSQETRKGVMRDIKRDFIEEDQRR